MFVEPVFLRMNQSMSTYWPNAIISKVNLIVQAKVLKMQCELPKGGRKHLDPWCWV